MYKIGHKHRVKRFSKWCKTFLCHISFSRYNFFCKTIFFWFIHSRQLTSEIKVDFRSWRSWVTTKMYEIGHRQKVKKFSKWFKTFFCHIWFSRYNCFCKTIFFLLYSLKTTPTSEITVDLRSWKSWDKTQM